MRITSWPTTIILLTTHLTQFYCLKSNNNNNVTIIDNTTILESLHKHTTENDVQKQTDDYITQRNILTSTNNDSNKKESYIKQNRKNESGLNFVQRRTKRNPNKEQLFDDAIDFGLKAMRELHEIKEPQWYKLGLTLDENDPASKVAQFGAPTHPRALELSRLGYAAVEASRKIAESFPENLGRQSAGFPDLLQSRLLLDECPLRGNPRCPRASRRYRTADGTCNNFEKPWRGSAMLPMQRFLPPTYEDGIQSIRRSVFHSKLPSPREISTRIHRDRNHEIQTVSLMFMQWGQFIDHDITSVVKSRSFNGSIPRCCERGGSSKLPPEFSHPSCLPIDVPNNDWFYSRFGIRCLEFIRSAPSTRIDCDLGWREQINQVTPYIDGSTIYGSDIETSDSIRTFRNGKIIYGRPRGGALEPPDPPGGELCRGGALTTDCFESGDGRVSEQPGLTAIHTIFVRYHNKIASVLKKLNEHWSDEKLYQETRRIVYSVIQHITYREFLPIVVGKEVMELFELNVERKGFYKKYDARVNPSVANSFSAAAFRFGHSMVQNSYVRTDRKHRPIFNNVSLHEDLDNFENIWSLGSIDRLLLGLCNQPSQRRDEFVCEELTNHLFQSPGGAPFGMDLAAINIQRGRDHGLAPYTAWRQPCGLSEIKTWNDLEIVMNIESVQHFRSLYHHIDDIDLFSGGLAEKPVRGGVVGPTFACIIAQQFLNLRRGDRFWYENSGFESSFTPAQLQQIRHVTLAHILCQTLEEIETIQPFVFLSHDSFYNLRIPCSSTELKNFDLLPWSERELDNSIKSKIDFENDNDDETIGRSVRHTKKRQNSQTKTTTTTTKPKKHRETLKIQISNVTTDRTKISVENKYGGEIPNRPNFVSYQRPDDDITYLVGVVPQTTPQQKPVEVNIKIQYYLPTTTTARPKKKKRPAVSYYQSPQQRPTVRPTTSEVYYPVFVSSNSYIEKITTTRPPDNYYYRPKPQVQYEDLPFSTSRPYVYRPTSHLNSGYNYNTDIDDNTRYPSYFYGNTNNRPDGYNRDDPIRDVYAQILENSGTTSNIPQKPTFGFTNTNDKFSNFVTDRPNKIYSISHVEKIDEPEPVSNVHDKLDFKTRFIYYQNRNDENSDDRFVKISSVRASSVVKNRNPNLYVQAKDGDGIDLFEDESFSKKAKNSIKKVEVVDLEVSPSEIYDSQWWIFNATDEELMPLALLPDDIDLDVICSKEIPQPINVTVAFTKMGILTNETNLTFLTND